MTATLLATRIPIQIDIGFGDVVTPGPTSIEFPTLLGHQAPQLRAYPQETVIAEKFEAMVKLAHNNTRMKDFYDVWVLSRSSGWGEDQLRQAIRATFARRQTPLPLEVPVALRDDFGSDASKTVQWVAFCRKSGLEGVPRFRELISDLRKFLCPLVAQDN